MVIWFFYIVIEAYDVVLFLNTKISALFFSTFATLYVTFFYVSL